MSDFPRKPGDRPPENNTDRSVFDPTIVGGRPSARSQSLKGIPRGIEVLVKKASVDPEFRSVLLEKRAAAAAEIGLELSNTEAAMLNAIPRAQIQKIIENTPVPDEHRRLFLGKIAAAMLAVLGIPLSGGCSFGHRKWHGTSPDWPDRLGIRPGGHTIDLPRTRPITISGTKVSAGSEQLRVNPMEKGSNIVDVVVSFECPFDDGLVTASFCHDKGAEAKNIGYHPTTVLVGKGKREVTIQATGISGETRWLEVKLSNRSDDRKNTRDSEPPTVNEYQAGEYVVKDRSILRVIEFRKTWKA